MRIALIGRTKYLLDSAIKILSLNYKIEIVITSKAEKYYNCDEKKFEKFCHENKIKYFCISNNDQKTMEKILLDKMDIAFSINWPFILNINIIKCFKLGIVNFHCGDLPSYRGNACPNWAILNNEKKIALTAHFMDEALDNGPILKKIYFDLNENTYITDIYEWINIELPLLLICILKEAQSGQLKPIDQSLITKEIIHCYPRKPIDSRIDWKNSSRNIHALIRASSTPFSGAYTFLENNVKVIIWKSSIYNIGHKIYAIPGQFLFNYKNKLVVACGEGQLIIEKIQIIDNVNDLSWSKIKSQLRSRFINGF